jgi:BirA family biotin operon repressor/biotin-[acetyl-CoA-carboxylase] ligase
VSIDDESRAAGSDEHPIAGLDASAIAALLAQRASTWPAPRLVASTGSTNADVEELARQGAVEGTCIVADEQTAGRGRLDRTWVSPPGAGLWMSVLLRPGGSSAERPTWLPLVAGLAVTDALAEACGVRAELKWPNDIVAIAAACGGSDGPRKLGGILSAVVPDAHDPAVVIGIGVNVDMRSADLPVSQATSVLLEGGRVDRSMLLGCLLSALEARLEQWRAGDEAIGRDYRARCTTIGRRVSVELPHAAPISGIVTGIDDDGHLLVDNEGITASITAGDVIHATI